MTRDRRQVGPIGRLGRWTARHFRIVAAAWIVVAVGLGVFAPRAEQALSGAGWEATRASADRRGLRRIRWLRLSSDPAVTTVVPPPGKP
jgi:hypothetical protein